MKISKREHQVLSMVLDELTTKEIAKRLCLSDETVMSHRKNIMAKLDVRNTAGMVKKAILSGLVVCMLCIMQISISDIHAQTRNLQVEGTGDQMMVVQTTSIGNSSAGIEFLRGNAFSATDWRIVNDGGTLRFENATNNFQTTPTNHMDLNSSGRLSLSGGSDATATNSSTGTLIIGNPTSFHIALDNNGIISRNGNTGSRLLLQTGLDQGDTYLNNISGQVGIGTLTPKTKLGVEDNGFQLRLGSSTDLTNEWYVGASHDGWTVGGDRLVFSPTSSSGDAMMILDKSGEQVIMRMNRVTRVADPVDDLDAVNLKTVQNITNQIIQAIQDMSFITPKEIMATFQPNLTFRECAEYCRNLDFGGHTDWKVPSVEEASHFVGGYVGSRVIWTTSAGFGSWAYGFKDFLEGLEFGVDHNRYTVDLFDGKISSWGADHDSFTTRTEDCRCVR